MKTIDTLVATTRLFKLSYTCTNEGLTTQRIIYKMEYINVLYSTADDLHETWTDRTRDESVEYKDHL